MQEEVDERLQAMLDRSEMRDILARYARGIDRGDAELLKSCYHADAIEEHAGNYDGNAHDYIDGAIPRVMQMGAMQHLLGSSHFDINGDTAYVETNVWTFVRFTKDDGDEIDTFTGGRLVDRFEKRDGTWKIAHRWTVLDWNRDTPSAEGWCLDMFDFSQKGARLGIKGKDDPSYERF
jgi:ketosteroid isomerase-like protein